MTGNGHSLNNFNNLGDVRAVRASDSDLATRQFQEWRQRLIYHSFRPPSPLPELRGG
jgi:hypothetical protein